MRVIREGRRKHCALINGMRDGGDALDPFSFSVAEHPERAVSTLHIVPQVTTETL